MQTIRRSHERGGADHGWLKTRHSFSFAEYHDPAHMGVSNLRVINEDRMAAGSGFGTHSHRDMEILSVVLKGALAHQDSMGNGAVIRPGEVQRMSAGRGVAHSEFNHQADAETHFLQIWIQPAQRGIDPGYEQKAFAPDLMRGRLLLVASGDGRDASVLMHADASIYRGLFEADQSARHPIPVGRQAYVLVAQGAVQVNGQDLMAGDAMHLRAEPELTLSHGEGADVLVFDLP